jgi:hypothetical protein
MTRTLGAEQGGSPSQLAMATGVTPEVSRAGGDGRRRTRLVTARDLELVRWIGRIGAVTIDQLMLRFGLGQTVAYERVAACVEARLLARSAVVYGAPTFLTATRGGLELVGLGLPELCVSTALARHHHACGDVALWLEERYGPQTVLSVRELVFEERLTGRPIASAKVGELPSGHPRLHRPDFAIVGGTLNRAIEVELTPKAPVRLDRIVRSWRRADWVEEVVYICAPGAARRAVDRAVMRTRSEDEIRVLGLEEIER